MRREQVRWFVIGCVVALVSTGCSTGDDDDAAESAEAEVDDAISIVNYNVLHGLPIGNCPAETDHCNAEARLDMMWELIEREADCPEVIALQEIAPIQTELIPPRLDDVCDGQYSLVSEVLGGVENWILSSLPVLDAATEEISGLSRRIAWVRLESDLGPVDVYTTHFVAGIDNDPCNEVLCAPGITAGICEPGMEAGMCNPLEALDFIDRTADADTVTILTGDLNASIDDDRIVTITDAGFVDVWALAELDECDPDTGVHCTSGQGGEGPYDGLDVEESTRGSRIDFVLLRAPSDCDITADDVTTGIFAGEPFDPPVDGLYWPSDHAGVRTAITCA